MLMDYAPIILVSAGILALSGALLINRRLVRTLSRGPLRRHWITMMALEATFVAGYIGYLFLSPQFEDGVIGLVVPAIFALGGVFVWANAKLSLRTAIDIRKLAVLEMESVTDPLTGLFNRRHLDRRLRDAVLSAQGGDAELSIIIIDLDFFKLVNDRFGHQVGDMVLVRTAELLRKGIRESDLVARFGGEEFVVLAPGAGPAEAELMAERIRASVAEENFALPTSIGSRAPMEITVSVGVACMCRELNSADQIISAADRNLYQAKRLGRNRVVATPLAA
ncbi:MAG: GGDEF domain-containing protein [Alphaproteobacteria bacterium]